MSTREIAFLLVEETLQAHRRKEIGFVLSQRLEVYIPLVSFIFLVEKNYEVLYNSKIYKVLPEDFLLLGNGAVPHYEKKASEEDELGTQDMFRFFFICRDL